MRVAYITAIIGNYEASTKPYQPQTVPADFICFTDNPDIDPDGWIIDTTPYHTMYPSKLDTGNLHNSIIRNTHTFNIAKYYKQNFYNIPRLKHYDIIVWLDATVEIINSNTTEQLIKRIKLAPIIGWTHEFRTGRLEQEVKASNWGEKYTSTSWLGQSQPYQDIDAQYNEYIIRGYKDDFWDPFRQHNPNVGVWITCFVAFDMRHTMIRPFLDAWYLETLTKTTQDQISFSYTCQSQNMIPYSLPDLEVCGDSPHSLTDLYYKHNHGK